MRYAVVIEKAKTPIRLAYQEKTFVYRAIHGRPARVLRGTLGRGLGNEVRFDLSLSFVVVAHDA